MEKNLADSLRLHAKTKPQHIALIEGDQSWTYAQLNDHVDLGAHSLLQLGLKPGDVVGLCLKDHFAHVVLMWSCMRAGLVMLPLDWRWTYAEAKAVIDHFKAVNVVVEPDHQLQQMTTCVWTDLLNDTLPKPDEIPELTTMDSPLLLSLSSGTTGRPKGPMITHQHFLRRFWTHWVNLGLNASSRYICATPLYFGGGRTFTLSVMFSGGTVILHPPPFEPFELANAIQKYSANALFLVPTQLRRLLACDAEVKNVFGSLQLLISSGSPLQPNEREAILKTICPGFFEYYASTEGGGVSLCTPQDFKKYLTSVGRPIFGVEVSIVDDEDVDVGCGKVGKLRYKGPGVADSFYNDPQSSAEHFKNGWFYPGDLAELNEDGYIFLRGRSKEMIIRGGVNIYPNEIQDTLMTMPGVHDCCVLGIEDPELGERVACAWVGESHLSQEKLELHCREFLAPYKVPSLWIQLQELPVNSGGKVVKDQIRLRLTHGKKSS
jgi:acyl-CoA synthetase (AMP-forming)/AMP-acid ligase II